MEARARRAPLILLAVLSLVAGCASAREPDAPRRPGTSTVDAARDAITRLEAARAASERRSDPARRALRHTGAGALVALTTVAGTASGLVGAELRPLLALLTAVTGVATTAAIMHGPDDASPEALHCFVRATRAVEAVRRIESRSNAVGLSLGPAERARIERETAVGLAACR